MLLEKKTKSWLVQDNAGETNSDAERDAGEDGGRPGGRGQGDVPLAGQLLCHRRDRDDCRVCQVS